MSLLTETTCFPSFVKIAEAADACSIRRWSFPFAASHTSTECLPFCEFVDAVKMDFSSRTESNSGQPTLMFERLNLFPLEVVSPNNDGLIFGTGQNSRFLSIKPSMGNRLVVSYEPTSATCRHTRSWHFKHPSFVPDSQQQVTARGTELNEVCRLLTLVQCHHWLGGFRVKQDGFVFSSNRRQNDRQGSGQFRRPLCP